MEVEVGGPIFDAVSTALADTEVSGQLALSSVVCDADISWHIILQVDNQGVTHVEVQRRWLLVVRSDVTESRVAIAVHGSLIGEGDFKDAVLASKQWWIFYDAARL